MNPIYEQLHREEKKYIEAVQKFHDALDAFKNLSPESKRRFFNDVIYLELLSELKFNYRQSLTK